MLGKNRGRGPGKVNGEGGALSSVWSGALEEFGLAGLGISILSVRVTVGKIQNCKLDR